MVILLGFALLAGAGTALSPCVLPVLPALLASGGAGGRRRPLGVVLGLSLTFAITIVGIAKVADGVGLGSDPLRAVAVVVLLGAGAVLLVPRLGGRTLFARVRAAGRGPALQRTLGAIMVVTALVIITGEDVRFDQYIAQHIPEVNLTASLEKSHAVESRLHEVTGRKSHFTASVGTPVAVHGASQATLLADARQLPVVATAPEFKETEDWFNTPGDRPLTLAGLRGQVVLVDFWTYTCINCIRTLPYLKAWNAAYHNEGLTIVGVETPEFSFEHDAANVASAISTFGLKYPVVQDNEYGTWDAYNNEYWPADYLIDAHGHVRYVAFGEGDYDKTESAIRALLAEAGHHVGGKGHPAGVIVPSDEATPETYLGTARAQGWVNGPVAGAHDYGSGAHPNLELDTFAYSGTWNISEQPAVAGAGAGIEANVEGRHVYLVLSSVGKVPRHVEVLLEGHRIPAADAGADVHNGIVTVRGERLYTLVSLPHDEHHHLTLRFEPGVTGYAFTFG